MFGCFCWRAFFLKGLNISLIHPMTLHTLPPILYTGRKIITHTGTKIHIIYFKNIIHIYTYNSNTNINLIYLCVCVCVYYLKVYFIVTMPLGPGSKEIHLSCSFETNIQTPSTHSFIHSFYIYQWVLHRQNWTSLSET